MWREWTGRGGARSFPRRRRLRAHEPRRTSRRCRAASRRRSARFADEAVLRTASVYQRLGGRAPTAVRAAAARLIGARGRRDRLRRRTRRRGSRWSPPACRGSAGDNVVAVADEYPSNVYPWFGLRRLGVETRLAARPRLRFGVDEIAALVDRRTRVVAVSAVDWQSGFRADLAALGAFCRARDIAVRRRRHPGRRGAARRRRGLRHRRAGRRRSQVAAGPRGLRLPVRRRTRVVERIHPVVLGWKSVDERRHLSALPLRRCAPDAAKLEPGTRLHLGIRALGAARGPAARDRRRGDRGARARASPTHLADALRAARRDRPESARARPSGRSILTFALGDAAASARARSPTPASSSASAWAASGWRRTSIMMRTTSRAWWTPSGHFATAARSETAARPARPRSVHAPPSCGVVAEGGAIDAARAP